MPDRNDVDETQCPEPVTDDTDYIPHDVLKGDPDFYEIFRVVIDLPNREAVNYAVDLFKRARRVRDEDCEDVSGFPNSFTTEVFDDWTFSVKAFEDGNRLFVGGWEGGTDAACVFLQHLLQKYYPNDYLAFEWSHCWGGGAAVITAEQITSESTQEWLHKNLPGLKSSGKQRNEWTSW
jgi:hypothetical protein